jgi:hypothetical protein
MRKMSSSVISSQRSALSEIPNTLGLLIKGANAKLRRLIEPKDDEQDSGGEGFDYKLACYAL